MKRKTATKKIKKEEDSYAYKGWLISDHFWKRMTAVTGHAILGGVLVQIIIFTIILMFFAFLGAIFILFAKSSSDKAYTYTDDKAYTHEIYDEFLLEF